MAACSHCLSTVWNVIFSHWPVCDLQVVCVTQTYGSKVWKIVCCNPNNHHYWRLRGKITKAWFCHALFSYSYRERVLAFRRIFPCSALLVRYQLMQIAWMNHGRRCRVGTSPSNTISPTINSLWSQDTLGTTFLCNTLPQDIGFLWNACCTCIAFTCSCVASVLAHLHGYACIRPRLCTDESWCTFCRISGSKSVCKYSFSIWGRLKYVHYSDEIEAERFKMLTMQFMLDYKESSMLAIIEHKKHVKNKSTKLFM